MSVTITLNGVDFEYPSEGDQSWGSDVTAFAQAIPGAIDDAVAGVGGSITVKDEGVTKTSSCTSIDFVGGEVTATNSGDAVTVTIPTVTTISGNAATATALQTARTINGTSFNGTADITVTAAAGTLTGSTLAAGVTASSLTSVGTITSGTWHGTAVADTYVASASTWNAKAASGANTDITSVALNQTGLAVKGASSNALTIKPNETLASAKTLNLKVNGADRTIDLSGDLTVSSAATVSSTNTGDLTLAAVGSSPSANGASISSQVLTLQPADATHPGLVTTGSQTFAGTKTFSSTISGDISGNAGTATSATSAATLTTARNINGVSFNGSASIITNWGLDQRPASAHAYDAEFEDTPGGDPANFGWTIGGSQQATAIDPYGSFNTATQWRYSLNSMRPSWLMFQPTNDATYMQPIHKSITVPTDFMVWARFSFNSRSSGTQASNDNGIALVLSATSSSAPDFNNYVALHLNETDANEKAYQWESVASGTPAGGTPGELLPSLTLPYDTQYVLIQKISTTYHYWITGPSGNWLWLASVTNSATMDRVAIRIGNGSSNTPGNMIVGCDFVRFYAGKDKLP